jgi:vancomycin resistance protein VanW
MIKSKKNSVRRFQPSERPAWRMTAGRWYYTGKRWFSWYFTWTRYAFEKKINEKLSCVYTGHRTPLIRQLSKADLQLQNNKTTNLQLACAKINGILIKPGETFSFWKLVGKPTRSKGYLDGMVLVNGSICSGTGGGLCQLSNLIYWMTLHTPLTITERWRHNYDVFPDVNREQPFGSGATVSYNYIDLQIKNDTRETFQLLVEVGDHYLLGEWRTANQPQNTYEVYESDHSINHEWWGGYIRQNVLRRRVYNLNHDEICDEFLTENHAVMMYEPMLP